MAAENVLAREVVELATKGLQKTERDIDSVRRRLQDADKAAARMQQTMQRVGQFARRAFFIATASLAGFIRTGLQGTKEGERLSTAFKNVSTQIASVFLPSIEKLSGLMERLAARFKNMSGEQQAATRRFAEGAIAAGATASVLGRLHPVLGAVAAGFTFAATQSTLFRSSLAQLNIDIPNVTTLFRDMELAIGGSVSLAIAHLQRLHEAIDRVVARNIGGSISAALSLAGIPIAAIQGKVKDAALGPLDQLIKDTQGRSDVTPTAPAAAPGTQARGFEDIPDTFKRLQLGALKGDQESEEQKQTKLLERILAKMSGERMAVIAVGGVAAVGA